METGGQLRELTFVKPEFRKDQVDVLDFIKTEKLDRMYEPGFKDILERNKEFHGTKVITPDGNFPNNKVFFRQEKNNIALIQNLYFRGDNSPLAANTKIVDMESGMFFNLSDLLTINGRERDVGVPNVYFSSDLFKTSGFIPTENGGIIRWNDSSLQRKLVDLKFGRGVGGLSSFLQLFHEFGHRFQFTNTDENLRSAAEIIKSAVKSGSIEESNQSREYILETERNAWAFGLGVMRKLKDGGVNISRGLNREQILKGVHMALGSYEKSLNRISGK